MKVNLRILKKVTKVCPKIVLEATRKRQKYRKNTMKWIGNRAYKEINLSVT